MVTEGASGLQVTFVAYDVWDVLFERAVSRDVHDLEAAADPEHGHVERADFLQQR
jgi:hypothetical protein